MKSCKELIDRLLSDYGTDTQVLGIIQVGSVAKGYADEHSDVDIEIVVTEDKYAELARNSQKTIHTEKYDIQKSTTCVSPQLTDSDGSGVPMRTKTTGTIRNPSSY